MEALLEFLAEDENGESRLGGGTLLLGVSDPQARLIILKRWHLGIPSGSLSPQGIPTGAWP